MTRILQPVKTNYANLLVLRMLIENQGWGVTTSSGGAASSSHVRFHIKPTGERAKEVSWDWFKDNRVNFSVIASMYQFGRLNNVEKPDAVPSIDDKGETDDGTLHRGAFSWYESPYVLTRQGRDYWNETGKDKWEAIEAGRLAELERVDRLIVISPGKGYVSDGRDRRYGLLARVVKETTKRLYVVPVEFFDGKPEPTFGWLDGLDANLFVPRDRVIAENITQDWFRTKCVVETEVLRDLARLKAQEMEEIKEIRVRFDERREQMKTMHDEMFSDTD